MIPVLSVDAHISRAIRSRRRVMGLSQQAVAERLGIQHQLVQKYEVGVCRVSAARLYEMARVLEQPVSAFFPVEGAGK